MSTPPLLELPSSACAGTMVMTLQNVVAVTESPYTMGEQSFRWPGQRWLLSFTIPPITKRAIAADWIAFGLGLKGRYGYFLAGDPLGKNPRGVASGAPVVDGLNQTGDSLATTGWTPNTQGILLKGDYFQLGTGSSSRLHFVKEDINSDASGNAVLYFEPELRISPNDGAPLTVINPRGVFRLQTNDFSWSVSPGPIYRLSFEASEVLP